MMNILFISHENNLGGGTKSLLTLIDEISVNENYNIYVFIPIFSLLIFITHLDYTFFFHICQYLQNFSFNFL